MNDAEERALASKIREELLEKDVKMLASLDEDVKSFINLEDDSFIYGDPAKLKKSFGLDLRMHLEKGGKPSEYFKANIKRLKGYLSDDLLPYFYRTVDTVNEWQTESNSYYRRSYRGLGDYTLYLKRFSDILKAYRRVTVQGIDIYSLLTGDVPEEMKAYFRFNSVRKLPDYYIAAKLDEGDPKLEELLTDVVYGEAGTLDTQFIRGMFMSHNERMYEVLGKTLVAARLSEGLRQAIAENMDFGTREGFHYLLKVIEENDLIRFASVKRAMAVFTGIWAIDSKDDTRIAKKTLSLILRTYEGDKAVEEMLSSEDSMEIFIGLWSYGTVDIHDGMKKAVELARKGSRHQRLTACYFLAKNPQPYDLKKYSAEIVREYNDDDEILANILPVFMPRVEDRINYTLYQKQNRYYYRGRYDRVYADCSFYFESEKECREALELLYGILDRVPKKGLTFEESVFPWNKEELTRNDLAIRIAFCASALKDEDEILKAAGLLKDITGEYSYRGSVLELLLRQPVNAEMLKILTEAVADPQEAAHVIAFALIKQEMQDDRSEAAPGVAAPAGRLPESCYDQLESMLRLKKAEIRANVIELLDSRGPEEKLKMLERIFRDGKEEKVTGGLDLILRLKKEEDAIFPEAVKTMDLIENPTTKEKILMDEIRGTSAGEESGDTFEYDKEATYTPVVDAEYFSEVLDLFYRLFPESDVFDTVSKASCLSGKVKKPVTYHMSGASGLQAEKDFIQKLDKLIEDHKDKEYEYWNGTQMIGNGIYGSFTGPKGNTFPLAEVWDALLQESYLSDGQLLNLYHLFDIYGYHKTINGYLEFFRPLMARIFGPVFADEKILEVKYLQQISVILSHYIYLRGLRQKYSKYIAPVVCLYLNETKEETEFAYTSEAIINSWQRERAEKDKTYYKSVLDHYVIRDAIETIREDDRNFPIHYLYRNGIVISHIGHESFNIAGYASISDPRNGKGPHPVDYISAAACGYISRDFLYKSLLDSERIRDSVETVSDLIKYIREAGQSIASRDHRYYSAAIGRRRVNELMSQLLKVDAKELEQAPEKYLEGAAGGNASAENGSEGENDFSELQKKKVAIAAECYENISRLIMSNELVRGDTPTEYSSCSLALKRVYGLDYLVRILSALGSETLDRTSMFFSYANRQISKRESMSHLLSVCIPDAAEGDAKEQAAKLKSLVKGTDIKEARLIEAGLYSPEWLPIIGEYLGWEGFMSGCYYFMAHMNEKFDDKRAAVIAKYSPLTEEEFNVGAFDIDWFREVYETLGKKRFEEIYKAAKYISDGSKHSRARKYADAARGEMDVQKTEAEIEQKRNKDLLMAYALIPCKDEERKERYSFIQKYIKESKQFGAQRRASEKAAGEMAVKNLAAASGYPDETRFVLKMEREISSELSSFFEPHEVGEYVILLEAGDGGAVSVSVSKGGKALKSLPAAIKKNEYVEDLNDAKKAFTEQYRRTRIMMEEAMESETTFLVSEIFDMCEDRVIGAMIRSILFKQGDFIGFPEEMKAVGLATDSPVVVAHPFHLYESGRWHDFQKVCFEKQLKQPFKQIFRELYVKTEEEKNLNESMRYAGNQVNPQKTVALLRSRRWVADEEDGLQKVYYKENIIATIYAMADWFSPSDIEAPTLEWVAFYDRKIFERKPISEIPDILFSEVMRDVDLAVSVAHAGEIDPEMSHSTIEMRRDIAEFVVSMLKLTNVTFTDSHALVKGERASYNIHLGSGVIHQEGGAMLNVLPVHSQNRGRIFLPFVDDDPKTAEIMSKIVTFAEDKKIKDPFILEQIR